MNKTKRPVGQVFGLSFGDPFYIPSSFFVVVFATLKKKITTVFDSLFPAASFYNYPTTTRGKCFCGYFVLWWTVDQPNKRKSDIGEGQS